MTTNKTPSILAKALKTISISYLAFLLIAGFIEFGLLAALLLILPLITFIYKKTHNNTTEGLDEKKNALSTQIITYILEVASIVPLAFFTVAGCRLPMRLVAEPFYFIIVTIPFALFIYKQLKGKKWPYHIIVLTVFAIVGFYCFDMCFDPSAQMEEHWEYAHRNEWYYSYSFCLFGGSVGSTAIFGTFISTVILQTARLVNIITKHNNNKITD